MANPPPPLVLASSSRYRRELLSRLGIPFAVVVPAIDEAARPGEAPAACALRLAEAKARAVAARHPDALILGSDQVADCDGAAISKPGDHATAARQLAMLSGRTVVFHTAVVLLNAARDRWQTSLVDVASTFRRLEADAIEAYLTREQPYDCAGSVRSEALGIALFERIESDDPTALIGLPLIAVVRMLGNEGVDVLALHDP